MIWFACAASAPRFSCLFAISVLVFLIFFATPGVDPAARIAGRNADPQTLAQVRHEFGLDRPLPIRYALMMKHLSSTAISRPTSTAATRWCRRSSRPCRSRCRWSSAPPCSGWCVGIAMGVRPPPGRAPRSTRSWCLLGIVGVSIPVYWLGEVVNLITQSRLHNSVFRGCRRSGYVATDREPVAVGAAPAVPVAHPRRRCTPASTPASCARRWWSR